MRNSRPLDFPRTGPTFFVLAIGAVAALILVFTTVDPWLDKSGILVGGLDVHVYRDGAWRILHGRTLYTEPTFRGLLYTYTPFSALAFLPIERVPWSAVTGTWLAVNIVVLLGCVLLSWRILGYRIGRDLLGLSVLLTATCLFLEPVRTTLYYGQINLVLMLLVLWDWSRADGSRGRGFGVGIAAGIKLVPGYFVVQFLALRQWRAAATASGVFVATVAVSWVVLPEDSRRYWTSTFFQSGRIAVDTHPANQSLRGALAHLIGRPAPVWLWLVLAAAVAVLSSAVVAELYRCGERLLAVTLAGLTACMVSPYAWGHHWVWFVPLLVYLVHRAQYRRGWWIAAIALFLSTGAWAYHWSPTWVSIGVFLLPPSWPVSPLLINAYVLAYCGVLAGSMVLVRRTRREVVALPEGIEGSQWLPLPRRGSDVSVD
ncbi:glycosyltransferase 87 family protein [Nocardia aurea]|uniref:glycosyltransferase 87 family protein n=1 Tax=Nocardia aurea TaxID=2144174 RepID=UPI0033ACDE3E